MADDLLKTVLKEHRDAIYLSYAELWAHHRALIAVVAEALGKHADHLETDVEAYYSAHLDELIEDGRRRLGTMMGKLPPPMI